MKTTFCTLMYRAAFAGLVVCSMNSSVSALEIVGHRGASFDAPENSLSAMKLAWKQAADGIETDIHLSKDGHIVISHDYDTKRTAGVEKKISDQTWEEIQQLDIGKWKGPQFAGEKMPSLDSFLATVPDDNCIFIEIKVPEPKSEGAKDFAILPALGKVMEASGKTTKQLRIITFGYDVAKAAKKKFPKHDVYWLLDYKKDKKTQQFPELDDMIKKAKDAKIDGLDLNFHFPIDKAFVDKVHKAGLKLYTWTVDDGAIANAEIEAGVDGITTNRPEWLRAQLKK